MVYILYAILSLIGNGNTSTFIYIYLSAVGLHKYQMVSMHSDVNN